MFPQRDMDMYQRREFRWINFLSGTAQDFPHITVRDSDQHRGRRAVLLDFEIRAELKGTVLI